MDGRRLAINRYSQGDLDSLDGLASDQRLLDLNASGTFRELVVCSFCNWGLEAFYEYAI